jgi:hypothetical protein
MAWGLALAGAIAVVVAVPQLQTLNNPAQEITLSATRGPESTSAASASADRPVTLRIDASDLPAAPAYAVEVVDVSGGSVWQGRVEAREGALVLPTGQRLAAGQYWVRVYRDGPNRSVLREFSLLVNE